MLRSNGAQVTGMSCDVADIVQVEALANHAIQTFGRIDIWINNAGLSAPYGPTAHIPSRRFRAVIDTNIIGTYNGSVVALRKMAAQKSGKLINLLGRGDTGGVPFQNAYSASKVWVRNFTKSLAAEYKDSGIDIFGFNPGLVKTEMLSQVDAVAGFEEKTTVLPFITAMWGNDADVPAEKALWLASAATDGKNGKMVTVLTPWFMLTRALVTGWRKLLHLPIDMMEMSVSAVEPVRELAPVYVEEDSHN
jgi:NAD(P)-dependent dehydrogenase (short-subunit alcohol dehydrogenase family)